MYLPPAEFCNVTFSFFFVRFDLFFECVLFVAMKKHKQMIKTKTLNLKHIKSSYEKTFKWKFIIDCVQSFCFPNLCVFFFVNATKIFPNQTFEYSLKIESCFIDRMNWVIIVIPLFYLWPFSVIYALVFALGINKWKIAGRK